MSGLILRGLELIRETRITTPAAAVDWTGLPAVPFFIISAAGSPEAVSGNLISMILNGDTGANYHSGGVVANDFDLCTFGLDWRWMFEAQISNAVYAPKPIINAYARVIAGSAPSGSGASFGYWNNAARINQITVFDAGALNFAAGSVFQLYAGGAS